MRKSLFFILLLSMIGLTNGARAQIAVMDTSIVQYLERPETGGKVKVVQPAQLAKRVSRAEGVIKYDGNKGYAQSSGFRIQVFSDNDYRTAKNNALYKEGLIQQAFPELETYVTFTSPFWRLRVGDFRSYEEAGFVKNWPSTIELLFLCWAMILIVRDYARLPNVRRKR